MKIKAYAKINLTLELTGEIKYGFHQLKSIMHKTKLYDELEVTLNTTGGISLDCDKELCATADNLAYKAAFKYLETARENGALSHEIGVDIVLKKHIPDGAGMGGGSADAAAVLRACHVLCGALEFSDVYSIACGLGSDIGFCLREYECGYCTGKGDNIKPVQQLPRCFVLIAKPSESLSTKGIFTEYDNIYGVGERKRDYATDKMRVALEKGDLTEISGLVCNDFEELCIKRLPKIGVVKKLMRDNGALCASMSGSGSAVFGLFSDIEMAKKARYALDTMGVFTFLDAGQNIV